MALSKLLENFNKSIHETFANFEVGMTISFLGKSVHRISKIETPLLFIPNCK